MYNLCALKKNNRNKRRKHSFRFPEKRSRVLIGYMRKVAAIVLSILLCMTVGIQVFAEGSDTPVWQTSKSKSAKATDMEDVYEVTLSLPAAEENLASDIVFVMDKSSCNEATAELFKSLLDELLESKEETGDSIKIAVVSFKGVAHYNFELAELTSENADDVLEAVKVKPDSSGSNIEAGLAKAKEILAGDTEVEDFRKYMILLSDGSAYQFLDDSGERSTIWVKFGNAQSGLVSWALPRLGKESSWDIPGGDFAAYWNNIKTWVANDGDQYVQGIDKNSIDPEKVIARADAKDHALCVDRALYDAWEVYSEMQDAGYHCYALPVGDRPIGTAFMNMLSGNSGLDFDDIQNDILYLLDNGSTVDDYLGYDENETEGYDFDFVNEGGSLVLNVGKDSYNAIVLEASDGADGVYGFKPFDEGGYAFRILYYKGDGEKGEHFVWEINEPVSNFAPVSLTYQVKLVGKSEIPGEHSAYTNRVATLYPVDSNGKELEPEEFERPVVKYTVPVPVASYKVEHYQEQPDGTYKIVDADTETINGIEVDTEVSATAKTYTGYTFDETASGTVKKGKVLKDGSLVLKLYYKLNEYKVVYKYTGTVPENASDLPETVTYKYGVKVTVAEDAIASGYTFSGWDKDDFVMPDEDVEIVGSFTEIPPEPEDDSPKTDDVSDVIGYAVSAAVSIIAVSILLVMKKRQNYLNNER